MWMRPLTDRETAKALSKVVIEGRKMRSGNRAALAVLLGGGLALTVSALRAGPFEDLSKEINDVAGRQFALQAETREREEKLSAALRKGTYDTPAMKELRQKIEALKRQIVEAQVELQRQFEELPAVRDDVQTVKAARLKIMEADTQRRELIERRERLVRPEPVTPAPSP